MRAKGYNPREAASLANLYTALKIRNVQDPSTNELLRQDGIESIPNLKDIENFSTTYPERVAEFCQISGLDPDSLHQAFEFEQALLSPEGSYTKVSRA
jgi:hypothetical protein